MKKYFENIIMPQFPIRILRTLSSSIKQTKKWRRGQCWYRGGKHNECEIYQKNMISTITNKDLIRTNERINMETYKIESMCNPLKSESGFEWTENFDGKQSLNDKVLYYNLKFICDSGGTQTRTLREVYHFVKSQLEYIYYINENQKNNHY